MFVLRNGEKEYFEYKGLELVEFKPESIKHYTDPIVAFVHPGYCLANGRPAHGDYRDYHEQLFRYRMKLKDKSCIFFLEPNGLSDAVTEWAIGINDAIVITQNGYGYLAGGINVNGRIRPIAYKSKLETLKATVPAVEINGELAFRNHRGKLTSGCVMGIVQYLQKLGFGVRTNLCYPTKRSNKS